MEHIKKTFAPTSMSWCLEVCPKTCALRHADCWSAAASMHVSPNCSEKCHHLQGLGARNCIAGVPERACLDKRWFWRLSAGLLSAKRATLFSGFVFFLKRFEHRFEDVDAKARNCEERVGFIATLNAPVDGTGRYVRN